MRGYERYIVQGGRFPQTRYVPTRLDVQRHADLKSSFLFIVARRDILSERCACMWRFLGVPFSKVLKEQSICSKNKVKKTRPLWVLKIRHHTRT